MITRKARRIVLAVVAAVLIIAGAAYLYRNHMDTPRTQSSIRKLDEHPLYVMTYYGDYGLKEFLKTGNPRSASPDAQNPDWACTCFAALSPEGDPVYGRNFDWDNDPILILFTDSPDGYASISTVDVRYLGITREELTDQDRERLLAAPYLPFDGMNEHGLVVGMMAVDAEAPYDPSKVTIDSLTAIRVMLDYAKTVDEAVDLICQYNIVFQGGPGLHYLVADRTGKSVVIEFIKGEMIVLPSENPWQVSTNFLIDGKTPSEGRAYCQRYATTQDRLDAAQGHLTMGEALTLLGDVSQESTLWSVVYNLRSGETQFTIRRNNEKVYPFQLKMK